MQASAGARKYAGSAFLRHLNQAAVETWPHIPIVVHQDHGASLAVCQRSIQLGFSSVMMDGSLGEDMKTPTSYDYNAAVTPWFHLTPNLQVVQNQNESDDPGVIVGLRAVIDF